MAACTPRPSVELEPDPTPEPIAELDEPDPTPEPIAESPEQLDARIERVCEHIYTVMTSEHPSMHSPELERDSLAHCVAGNRNDHAKLGEQRWTERATCTERGRTIDELMACDREPSPAGEPEPVGPDKRALCSHMFEIHRAEDHALVDLLTPPEFERVLQRCIEEFERDQAKDPVVFDREARCLMTTKTSAEWTGCNESDR